MIQLVIPANFWLTVTSYIWMNSLCFFLSQPNLLPTNFHITMKSSSHTPVTETTPEDNSPPKLSHLIILFRL